MNLAFLIWAKISVWKNTGQKSGIIILFNARMSIITRFLGFPLTFLTPTKTHGNENDVAITIHSIRFCSWSLLNWLSIIFLSRWLIRYTRVWLDLYNFRQFSTKGISMNSFSMILLTFPVSFHKTGYRYIATAIAIYTSVFSYMVVPEWCVNIRGPSEKLVTENAAVIATICQILVLN